MELTMPYATVEAFLDNWQGVRMVTLELLACFDNTDLGYRLVPEWRTVGQLFYHIGDHQYFAARGILLRRWRPLPGEPDVGHEATTAGSAPALRNWLLETQAAMRQWAGQADATCLTELRPDIPWHEGMRGWLLLHHAYQDELHHRGQLYAIARHLKNVPPVPFAEEYPAFW